MTRKSVLLAALVFLLSAGDLQAKPQPVTAPRVIDVMAVDYAFAVPTEIPAGWTTFRLQNRGREVHIMSLAQLPAPVELREIRALNSAYVRDQHQLKSGSITPAQAAERWQAMEPGWWGDIEMQGGVGFVSPGQVGETTLYLEPGLYELTCHIKTRDGKSHFIMGMRAHIRVTGEGSATVAPTAQAKLTVSSNGLVLAGELGRGEQLVEIHYTDSPDPLHDVHLAKLDARDSELQAAHWMEEVQAPAPVIFLGGVGHLRGGESGYFSASYQPGHYMFLCQQHPEEQLVFEIPEV